MKLRNDFIADIKHLNGKKVTLAIVQITPETHPLGQLGYMMMGQQQTERIKKAEKEYKGQRGVIEIEAEMELINNDEGFHLLFIPNNYECNCIEIFRPEPPMIIEGMDMSLWWSYHPLTQHEINKLTILKEKYLPSVSTKEGDCHPIRELFVNGVRHGR
jgi:hypothetical protein